MKIKDERTKGSVTFFTDLKPGDVYEYEDEILMKIESISMPYLEINCISLEDGLAHRQDFDDKVTPLVVQLNVIREE